MSPFDVDQSPDLGHAFIDPKEALLATASIAVAGVGGGYTCGLVIDQFGELGSASLWALGALAGSLGRRLLKRPSRLVGWATVVACIFALVVAETCWIHWNIKQGAEGFWTAMALLPSFVGQFKLAAMAGVVFTCLGAWSGYRQITAQ